MTPPLEDQLEILQLLYRYSHALDSGDAEAFASLFADDGVFTDPEGSYRGRGALVELVRRHHRDHPDAARSQHWLQAPVITGDGDQAEVDAYVIVFKPSERFGAEGLVMGAYHDELARTPERGWVFQHRRVLRAAEQELHPPAEPPPPSPAPGA